MITILADYNMNKQALLLWDTLNRSDWSELLHAEILLFKDIGLPADTNDRDLWRFCQANNMLLITNNRSDNEVDSLERTIREEGKADSLPVITVGNLYRIREKTYREKCVEKIVEIIIYLDNYRGSSRIYIP